MNSIATSTQQRETESFAISARIAKQILHKILSHLQDGQLTIIDNQGREVFGSQGQLSATITVNNYQAYRRILFEGSIGAGESYMDGQWSVDNLTNLVRLMVVNSAMLDRIDDGMALVKYPFQRIRHLLRRNSITGSKRNIMAHYDLGNELYKSFLDPSMMYSSAIYPSETSSLEEASEYKLETICKKLQLKPTDRIVEIGSGWGGFAIYAAQRYGCHVTTTTISEEQFQEASQRIKAHGLTDRITLLKEDYRRLKGSFDKLVSIEMIEAVGEQYLPRFFKTCSDLLKKDGVMLLQGITIADQRMKSYARNVDFIQRHIFPGGFLPSNSKMLDIMRDKTDLVVRSIEDFGFDYARTLMDWRQRFLQRFSEIQKFGFDERFKRLWEFYLSYCEGGFLERSISVVHITATKPDNRLDLKERALVRP